MGSGADPGAVVGLYDWTRVGHVVDVGGGNGTVLAFVLRTNPQMRGTLVELPGPAERARQKFEEGGGRERTLPEFKALARQAGLSLLSVRGSAWPSLLEFAVD